MVRETRLTPDAFIYPLFVVRGRAGRHAVESMPGIFQLSVDEVVKDAKAAADAGVPAVLLFAAPAHKDARATSATDPKGLAAQAIAAIKEACPQLLVWADVCLCGATDHGHCGHVLAHGAIDNDSSVQTLAEVALNYARAGADAVAPSDMMDGRVAAIRARLDAQGHAATPIVSYAAKFASSFYGPFREAAEAAPAFGDRRSYQMDPANGAARCGCRWSPTRCRGSSASSRPVRRAAGSMSAPRCSRRSPGSGARARISSSATSHRKWCSGCARERTGRARGDGGVSRRLPAASGPAPTHLDHAPGRALSARGPRAARQGQLRGAHAHARPGRGSDAPAPAALRARCRHPLQRHHDPAPGHGRGSRLRARTGGARAHPHRCTDRGPPRAGEPA